MNVDNEPGWYVVRFPADDEQPERVKIGKSNRLRVRLLDHCRAGAVEARAFVHVNPTDGCECDRRFVELHALALAGQRGQRVRSTESFAGLPFSDAVDCVRQAILTAEKPIWGHERRVPMETLTGRGERA